MSRPDPHSYADPSQPRTDSLHARLGIDFDARVVEGEATLRFATPGGGPLDLDTRGLEILAVADAVGDPLPFVLHPEEPILGSRLAIELPPRTPAVTIRYRTAPTASALQWLEPAQTAGRREPFLYSQCQAIHARSVVPLQDTPRIRLRYRVELTIPRRLRGLMAAAFVSRREEGALAVETWEMPQPIPPYLFAFAAGDLASRDVGPRSRVWAEPSLVDAAAWEFADVDRMLRAGEELFGAYEWDRFDILTMPPSFPYGGMENPRCTFLTPTLLAGDRSLVSVVAHELAHSWTGNLVTNADAEHFWINEGWTRYAELRIVEATSGVEAATLRAALGGRALDRALARFADERRPELTRLCTSLAGVDPDEAFSEVPYEKGYLFLRALEEQVGRARFDAMIRAYIARFRFQSITTDELCGFLDEALPGALAAIDAPAWIDGPGLPDRAPRIRSARIEEIERLAAAREAPSALAPNEWVLYLDSLATPAPRELLAGLDRAHALGESRNADVLYAWLRVAIESRHDDALPRAERFLGEVGRMKYLRPLYKALSDRDDTRPLARRWFEAHAPSYHPIARRVIETARDPV